MMNIEQLLEQIGERFRWLKQPKKGRWLAQARGVTSTIEEGRQIRSKDVDGKGSTPQEALHNLLMKLE